MWNDDINKKVKYLVIVGIRPTIVILALSVLNKPIQDRLLIPLWKLADMDMAWDISILTAIISAIVFFQGWIRYKCKHGLQFHSWYLLAFCLYCFYRDKWTYVETHYCLDCWFSLLAAYPLGWILHRAVASVLCLYHKIRDKNNASNKTEWTVPAMVMLEDDPIETIDADEFRYDGSAQRIARTIIERKSTTSYSLGITGAWGAGKTSMLNLVKNYLGRDDSVIIIDFNPRESADVTSIQMDFLTAVCNTLKDYHTGVQSVLTDYMKALRILAEDTIWTKLMDVAQVADIEVTRQSVETVISEIGKRIVVLIDDFDRLTGEEILEVLKVIDKNGSFKHTVFISAYDKEYVNSVLRNYLKDETTRDFTDKYFNLELRLPDRKQFHKNGYMQRRLYALIDNGVIKNVTKHQIDDALSEIVCFMDEYLPTARDIKRYIGLTMATYVEVQYDVALKDYLLVSLVKYKYSNEYDNLYRQRYFAYSLTGTLSNNNFVLKDEKDLKDVQSFPVLKLLFPSNANSDVSDKKFGYKHLSWKRSFDYYFFDQELGHIPSQKLIPLADPDITLEKFELLTKDWTSKDLLQDVADFVISRMEMVHTPLAFKNYLRLLVMARYYCPHHQLYWMCCQLFFKNLLDDNSKRFKLTEKEYCDIIDKFISVGGDWVLQAILLQDVLHRALKLGDEVEMIFSTGHLQKVASDRMRHVLKTFKAQRATTEDVYEILKANVAEVEPTNVDIISEKALTRVREDMVANAKRYFRDIVWHKPLEGNNNGIEIGFNRHLPLVDLFPNNDQFALFLRSVEDADNSLTKATNCLFEIYDRVRRSKFRPIRVPTKGSPNNIKQCDFEKYNLIFEGER